MRLRLSTAGLGRIRFYAAKVKLHSRLALSEKSNRGAAGVLCLVIDLASNIQFLHFYHENS